MADMKLKAAVGSDTSRTCDCEIRKRSAASEEEYSTEWSRRHLSLCPETAEWHFDSIVFPQRRRCVFFPWSLRVHSSRPKKASRRRLSLRFSPFGMQIDRLTTTIEAVMGAAREDTERPPQWLRSALSTANGFSGSVKTLNLNVKTVTLSPADGDNGKNLDFRIFATEFGAAWKKTSREGRGYHSVKLDDPSFPAPIYASLVETDTEGDFSLIWSRRAAECSDKARSPAARRGFAMFRSGAA